MSPDPPGRRLYQRAWLPASAGMLGLALLVFFDLGPPVALNDDWVYAWSVKQMVAGRWFRNLPEYGVLHAPQTAVGYLLTLGHADPRLLRLTVVPFAIAACVAVFVMSRRLGATRFWSAVAAVTPACLPIYLVVATGFMTDFFYLGLEMLACWFAFQWIRRPSAASICVVFAALATLERPQGVLIAPALTLAFCFNRRRSLTIGDRSGLAALWATTLAAALGPIVVAPEQYLSKQDVSAVGPFALAVLPVMALPAMLCTLATPFVGVAVSALAACPNPWRRMGRGSFLPFSVAWLVLVGIGLTFAHNVWGFTGLGPETMRGAKPPLPVAWLGLIPVTLVSLLFPLLVLSRRQTALRDRATPASPRIREVIRRLQPEWVLLLTLSAGHLAGLSVSGVFDRYYLAVVVPLLPLAAVLGSQGYARRSDHLWAVATLSAGLLIYAVGIQDYLAWQQAREEVVKLVPAGVSMLQVDAGYEANATHAVLPYYEAAGRYPGGGNRGGRGGLIDLLLQGPSHPRFTICFAGPDAPGVGVAYRSMAPGRVLLVPGGKCPGS